MLETPPDSTLKFFGKLLRQVACQYPVQALSCEVIIIETIVHILTGGLV
jgi:hypothetical protein